MGYLPNSNKDICSQILNTGKKNSSTKHFFAKSHGKGVVDGIGGSVKGSVHRKILTRTC